MSESLSLKRRDFVKLTLAGSAGAAAAGCQTHNRALAPLLVPEQPLIPDVAYWSRGLCRQCEAGCGVLIKRMEAIVPLKLNGQPYRQARLVAKKLEGNPEHPVNRGGLCARGQAGLEATYHPLRLSAPMARPRPGAGLEPQSWEAALAGLRHGLDHARPGEVAWLGRPLRGTEAETVAAWLGGLKARWWEYRALPAPRAAADAARWMRLRDSDFLLSFGNFLETWPNQAGATRAYSQFRRNPASYFIQAEPRLSLTGTNADAWVALRPGSEGIFALALAAQWLAARGGQAGAPAWLKSYTPDFACRACDLPRAQFNDTLHHLLEAQRPLVLGGPNAYAHAHAGFQAEAIQLLARLVEPEYSSAASPSPAAVGKASGNSRVITPQPFPGAGAAPAPRLLFVHEVNPAFSAPAAERMTQWLRRIPQVVVLGTWPDETMQLASLALPLSTPLESWTDDERAGEGGVIASLNPPAMRPLHDTRSLLEIVDALAPAPRPAQPTSSQSTAVQSTPAVAAADEEASYTDAGERLIRAHWLSLQQRYAPSEPFADFWEAAVRRGGYWPTTTAGAAASNSAAAAATLSAVSRPQAPAAPQEAPPALHSLPPLAHEKTFPLHLHIYESSLMGDGAGSWLTWLQELPDPTTSAMWCNWVEVHPQLAAKLGLKQGDGVWVESAAGKVELPVFFYPGLRPDAVAIPTGQGHTAGEALTNRGSNPFPLLADVRDPETGALAWEANYVRLMPSGRRPPLPLFGHSLQRRVTHR